MKSNIWQSQMLSQHLRSVRTANACPFVSRAYGNRVRDPILKQRGEERAKVPLELVHSNVGGPTPVESNGGAKYFILFIDDISSYIWVYTMPNKSNAVRKF